MRRSYGRFLGGEFDFRRGIHRGVAALAAILIAAPAGAEPPPAPPAPPSPPASAARPSAAAPDDKARKIKRANELDDEALELYERGEYRAAIVKLEAAVALDPEGAELFYNLGLIHERLGELEIAEKHYRRDLALETDPKLRERAQGILKRLEGAKKQLPPEPRALPPAPAPRPPDSPRHIGPGVIAAASLAGAALLSGVGFGIGALVENPGSDAKTGPGVSIGDLHADARHAHQLAIVSDISLITCAVASGAALLFYFSVPPPASSSRSGGAPPRVGQRIELDLSAGRAALRVVF